MAPASVEDLVSRDQNKTRCQELLGQVGSKLKTTARKVRQTSIVLELHDFFQAAVQYLEQQPADADTGFNSEQVCRAAAQTLADAGHAGSFVQLESLMSSIWNSKGSQVEEVLRLMKQQRQPGASSGDGSGSENCDPNRGVTTVHTSDQAVRGVQVVPCVQTQQTSTQAPQAAQNAPRADADKSSHVDPVAARGVPAGHTAPNQGQPQGSTAASISVLEQSQLGEVLATSPTVCSWAQAGIQCEGMLAPLPCKKCDSGTVHHMCAGTAYGGEPPSLAHADLCWPCASRDRVTSSRMQANNTPVYTPPGQGDVHPGLQEGAQPSAHMQSMAHDTEAPPGMSEGSSGSEDSDAGGEDSDAGGEDVDADEDAGQSEDGSIDAEDDVDAGTMPPKKDRAIQDANLKYFGKKMCPQCKQRSAPRATECKRLLSSGKKCGFNWSLAQAAAWHCDKPERYPVPTTLAALQRKFRRIKTSALKFAGETGVPVAVLAPLCLQRSSGDQTDVHKVVRNMKNIQQHFPTSNPLQGIVLRYATHGAAERLVSTTGNTTGIIAQMEVAAHAQMETDAAQGQLPEREPLQTDLRTWLETSTLTPAAVSMIADPAKHCTKAALLAMTDDQVNSWFPGLQIQAIVLRAFLDAEKSHSAGNDG
ncbi:hypothetical protein WJX73_010411 [Symbiochloris irregularis]|uniref:Uncharacterized protein n=1 Tax=Symbiochloris irregularis TaxID=706552 RepID=A0AAW1NUN0_9CHLO